MKWLLEKRRQSRAIRWLIDFSVALSAFLLVKSLFDMGVTPISELPGTFWLIFICFIVLSTFSSFLQRKVDNILFAPKIAGIQALSGAGIVLVVMIFMFANGWSWNNIAIVFLLTGLMLLIDGLWQIWLLREPREKRELNAKRHL